MRQYFSHSTYETLKRATRKANYHKTLEKKYGLFAPKIPQCTIHNRLMVKKPSGYSKRTGKHYNAFWACPIKDKLGFCSQTYSINSTNELPKINSLSHWKK